MSVELMNVLVDSLVGIVIGGRGKLLIHPKLDVDEEEVAEISIGAIDDGKIRHASSSRPWEEFVRVLYH